ncbi:response regulator transcription factor [Pseudacidovorax intermedius]|uniref:Transcriptional regulator n=1 Tax=Pseudacidovorax intermedius TaxID=433924 RepID=A0A147H7G2_9BURK|nr:response regulator transcription factor [Pseudacidovorax intermedius]KTT25893.1 transcriptional regulator [Pseudacidovorax intermedius]
MRILLVEDDGVLSGVMQRSLGDAGHAVQLAATVEDADTQWSGGGFDAVLLDLNLPETARPDSGLGSGLLALRRARARGDRTPVMVLTARNRTEERVIGLDSGADDYLGKPFDPGELEARLRALVRRAEGAKDVVAVGRLQLDRRARRFRVAGEPLDLPAREFGLLWALMSPPGQVLAKRELARKLAEEADGPLSDNALEAFVSRLRKRLVDSGVGVRTLRGIGYRLEADAA